MAGLAVAGRRPSRGGSKVELGIRGESFSLPMGAVKSDGALSMSRSSGSLPQLLQNRSRSKQESHVAASMMRVPSQAERSSSTPQAQQHPFITRRLRPMFLEESNLLALPHVRRRPSSKGSAALAVPSDSAVASDSAPTPHPPSFYCPITHQCMHDPVVLTDGHTYERRHIEKWLREKDTSPVSGAELSSKSIFPNHALRNAIEEYFQQVLKGHRLAIRQALQGIQQQGNFTSSTDLLETIDSLMQCSILVNADLSLECVLRRIMDEARSLVGAEVASVFLVDRKRRQLYSTVNSTGSELRIPMESGVAGSVASTGVPLIIDDAYSDVRFNTAVDLKTGFKTRSILCMPIRAYQSETIGVAQLINKTSSGVLASSGKQIIRTASPPSFTQNDLHFLQVFAAQAGAAIVNSGMFECMPSGAQVGEDGGAGRSSFRGIPSPSSGSPSNGALEAKFQPSGAPAPRSHLQLEAEPRACALGGIGTHCPARQSAIKPLLSASFGRWDMDTLALAELSGSRSLSVLGMYLFEKLGLIEAFCIDVAKLQCLLSEIEKGYPVSNPYHNQAHAASVLHFTHVLLSRGGIAAAAAPAAAIAGSLGGEEGGPCHQQVVTLAALLAAIVHDYEHDGCSNDYHIKAHSRRSVLYNDRSPNENHHVAAAFKVMARPACNILEGLSAATHRAVRRLTIELVLSTDPGQTEGLMQSFKAITGVAGTGGERDPGAVPEAAFAPASAEDALLVLKMALKCADLGHLALSWSLHMQWVWRLEAEFYAQGDREKQLKPPEVSYLMDRDKAGVSKSQVGFFDFVALPVFRLFVGSYPAATPMLAAVEANYQRWCEVESDDLATIPP